MTMTPIRDINIQNQEFLDMLESYKDYIMHREDGKMPRVSVLPVTDKHLNAEDFVSDDYMHKIIKEGRFHDGFPKVLKGFRGLKHDPWVDERMNNHTDYVGKDIKEKTEKLNSDLIGFLSCRNNALNAVYPPGGFIAWHNNANASGYNIIITWSETGEGWFDYWDTDKKERVRIQDKRGWQAKMTYFGPYDDPDKLCYHAAYTDCYRITIAFVFAEADNFWEEVIEDLETPC